MIKREESAVYRSRVTIQECRKNSIVSDHFQFVKEDLLSMVTQLPVADLDLLPLPTHQGKLAVFKKNEREIMKELFTG